MDASGRTMVPGAEVQLIEHDSGSVLGTRLVDSGGGYCSQGGAPAHFGIPAGVERGGCQGDLCGGSGEE